MRILLNLIENKLAQSVIAYWHTPPPRQTIVRSPDRSWGCSPAVRTQACTSCRRPRYTRCRSGRSRSSRSPAAVNPGNGELQSKIKVLRRSVKKGLAIRGNTKNPLNKNVVSFQPKFYPWPLSVTLFCLVLTRATGPAYSAEPLFARALAHVRSPGFRVLVLIRAFLACGFVPKFWFIFVCARRAGWKSVQIDHIENK